MPAKCDDAAFTCRGRREFAARLDRLSIAYQVARVPQTTIAQLFLTDPAGNGVELNFADGDD